MTDCIKCASKKYEFHRRYHPTEYIDGYADSPVWIIGLNPAWDLGFNDDHTTEYLQDHLVKSKSTVPYFKDFRSVSPTLYANMGLPSGVAHTDIVKCYSRRFPSGKAGGTLVSNCNGYLKTQIENHRPKLLVCNGAQVSDYIRNILPPNAHKNDTSTSYLHDHDGYKVGVVLSGFIGRIDRFARRRLGQEIELRMSELGILLGTEKNDDAA